MTSVAWVVCQALFVGDIRSSMMEEVDFTKEAANILAFQNYLDAAGITGRGGPGGGIPPPGVVIVPGPLG